MFRNMLLGIVSKVALLIALTTQIAYGEAEDRVKIGEPRSIGMRDPITTIANATHRSDTEMNGISFSSIRGFWNNWHLVTARYRIDTKEMRFIYANDIAWRQIDSDRKKGIIYPSNYPEGAMFGKVAYTMSEDKLFASSLMPDRVIRYQVMVKDSKKYEQSQGWGYAIFAPSGQSGTANAQASQESIHVTEACSSCHEQAKQRGYVFIGQLNAEPNEYNFLGGQSGISVRPVPMQPFVFKKRNVSEFGHIFDFLGATEIEVSEQPAWTVFLGTLDESIPLLIKHLHASQLPSAIISSDKEMWVVTYPDTDNRSCAFIRQRSLMIAPQSKDTYHEIFYHNKVCQ